jgi:hypothetical protein
MILDSTNLFSNNQAIIASGNTLSANVVDLGINDYGGKLTPVISPRDIGPGEEVNIFIICTENVTSGSAATVQFSIVTADDAALSVNATTLIQTVPIAKYVLNDPTTLYAGAQVLRADVPVNRLNKGQRYLGVVYNASAALTAGKFTAGLAIDLQANIAHPSGLNTSYT